MKQRIEHCMAGLVCMLALQVVPVHAATEVTGDIPVALARTLLGMAPGQETRLYSDLPDTFPVRDLPDAVDVLISVDLSYQQRVLLRPLGDAAAAHAALEQNLVNAGWELLQSSPMMQTPQTGFVSGPPVEMPVMYCNEGAGLLQVSRVAMAQDTVLQLSYSRLPAGAIGPCSQNAMDQAYGRGGSSALQQYMPRLELPQSMTGDARGLRPAGITGSMSYYESNATAEVDMSLIELFEHFTAQVEAQGWVADTSNTGGIVANGFWRKQPERDLDLVGTLTIMETAARQYELGFRVQRLGGGGNRGVIGVRP